jgi:hypothetical protein
VVGLASHFSFAFFLFAFKFAYAFRCWSLAFLSGFYTYSGSFLHLGLSTAQYTNCPRDLDSKTTQIYIVKMAVFT